MDFDRILVPGTGGFLGRYVMTELAGRCAVTGLDLRRPADAAPLYDLPSPPTGSASRRSTACAI